MDGRSAVARRYRDIAAQIIADMGGASQCAEARLQLIRRFAAAAVLAEQMEARLAANHTYRTVEWPVAKRMSPQKGTTLKRGGEYKIAGQNCIDWSWMDGTEMHTACLTRDGVLLRLIIDGQVVAEARSVLYAQQPPELFEVPSGYEPALAPEGGPAD